MRYQIEILKFVELVGLYDEGKLNLNPPYQRNSIWTTNNQRLLIDTLKNGLPLPTFFIQENDLGFDMVDGQQRTRAILSFIAGDFSYNGQYYAQHEFDDYEIAVVKLDRGLQEEDVRQFYVRVNRAGAKLERPELIKAEYFKTRFLAITTKISEMVEFRDLKIVKNAQVRRMFDRDFIEEISAMILYGPQDKKKTVDDMFANDISEEESQKIEDTFKTVLERMASLNSEIPLSDTRFIQKNDFYTLFNFIMDLEDLSITDLTKIYKVLVLVSKGISPSNDECLPLKEYAENCVTQSNSKKARLRRLEILKEILLSTEEPINESQLQVASYFNLPKELTDVDQYFTLKVN